MADTNMADEKCDGQETCWICLQGDLENDSLIKPCNCPRIVHRKCLALWQLHSAGKSEEKFCRFCNSRLPEWKEAFQSPYLSKAKATIAIEYKGQVYKAEIDPGRPGVLKLQNFFQKLTGVPVDEESFDITLECRIPGTDSKLRLRGLQAFDAVLHCALICAAERQRMRETTLRNQEMAAQASAAGNPETASTRRTHHGPSRLANSSNASTPAPETPRATSAPSLTSSASGHPSRLLCVQPDVQTGANTLSGSQGSDAAGGSRSVRQIGNSWNQRVARFFRFGGMGPQQH